MDFKRFPWDLIKTLKPASYSAAGGIEVKIDCMHADIVGTREALQAHTLFGQLLIPGNKQRCWKTRTRCTRKRDGRVRIIADAHRVASLDADFQRFLQRALTFPAPSASGSPR